MTKTIDMTLDEWSDMFKPSVPLDEVPDVDFHYIWTAVDGDDGQYCISEGVHWVNRINYFVSDTPWEDGVFYNIVDDYDWSE